jgi:hypothetical protein
MKFQIDPKTARAIKKHPHRAIDLVQSLSEKQVACKQWLYDTLINIPIEDPKKIFIAGSWYGNVLVPFLQDIYPDSPIKLHDIDEEAIEIAKKIYFIDDDQVKCEVMDSSEYEYHCFLINTSCEHMSPLQVKKKTHVVLQSNNYRGIDGHINCVDSAEELAHQYNVSEIYYSGELEFENYTRFMIIGRV